MEKEEQSSEPPSQTASLPRDLVVDILARVSRSDYPALSLVSKHFRSIVSSCEVYARRSLLGCTEHCLYVFLADANSKGNRCYILRRKTNGEHGLFLVPSLPSMPYGSRFVAVGSKIYVFGTGKNSDTSLSIDCGSYTVQPLPSMHVPLSYTVAGVMDGRIYVIGRHQRDLDKMMVLVFNTETQTWETDSEMTTSDIE
ncbi:hypothetical protein Bca4012_082254 [Brassica carinata]